MHLDLLLLPHLVPFELILPLVNQDLVSDTLGNVAVLLFLLLLAHIILL